MARRGKGNQTQLGKMRENAGYSRTEAAVILGVGINTLDRYESGQSPLPLEVAEDMTTLYSVPFDTIRNACASLRKPNKRSILAKGLALFNNKEHGNIE